MTDPILSACLQDYPHCLVFREEPATVENLFFFLGADWEEDIVPIMSLFRSSSLHTDAYYEIRAFATSGDFDRRLNHLESLI